MSYSKQNDYTLIESNPVPGGKGTLTRLFNFAAGTVTTVFRESMEKEKDIDKYSSGGYAVSVAVAAAITSEMQIQKFSEFDTTIELNLMRQELIRLGGKPPTVEEVIGASMTLRKDLTVSKPLQIKN